MVDKRRVYPLNSCRPGEGSVICWIQRDQRVRDNWALLYAQEQALEMNRPLRAVFCVAPGYLRAGFRQYDFLLKGLQEVEKGLHELNIPFDVLRGDPGEEIPRYAGMNEAGMLVTDFNPLKMTMKWKEAVKAALRIPFAEVDAHNILPCRVISDKAEYAAFTFRKKVEKQLAEYLTGYPEMVRHPGPGVRLVNDWDKIRKWLRADSSVPGVDWILPGEKAAGRGLADFIANRLDRYATDRNFPEKDGQSGLSPWLHFGHLSAQRVALEVQQSQADPASKMAFLEELIVRRELADNFCLYNRNYDRVEGFRPWAKTSLGSHRDDPREYLYTADAFESGHTHDDLWNAAQREMVALGKMHGFMRMYWAKKILEWTPSPEEAMAIAIYLNDKYELDGRDPNGYAGIAWSIGGTHDRPWGERKVFGTVRYMNDKGCRRKFRVDRYMDQHQDKSK